MRPRRFMLAMCLVLTWAPRHAAAAAGQTAPGTTLPAAVTLDDVLTLLAARSPRTAADQAAVAVAAADRTTARTLPNPSISYGGSHLVGGLSTGAITQHQVIVEQPLLLGHQRRARLEQADLTVGVEAAHVSEKLAERRLAVRQAFASLLARQEQLTVTEASLADLERIAQLVRGRAEAGDRSQYDVARIETEAGTLRALVINAEADVADASGHLAALLGFPGWSPHATGSLDATDVAVPADVNTLWEAAQQRLPSLVAIRRQQAASRGGLLLARRERLPVPALSGGVQETQQVQGTSAFLGLSVPLPFFDRNQGAIARASAQIDADRLTLDAETAEARADLDRAAAVLAKRRQALASLENAVVGRGPGLRRMAEAAYREGSGDILELLDAMRSLKDIQLTHVQQLESVRLAEEQVVSAAGLDLPPADK